VWVCYSKLWRAMGVTFTNASGGRGEFGAEKPKTKHNKGSVFGPASAQLVLKGVAVWIQQPLPE